MKQSIKPVTSKCQCGMQHPGDGTPSVRCLLDRASCDEHEEALERIPYGDIFDSGGSDVHCSGCGVPRGGYHHTFCDYETCPFCVAAYVDGCTCEVDGCDWWESAAMSIV